MILSIKIHLCTKFCRRCSRWIFLTVLINILNLFYNSANTKVSKIVDIVDLSQPVQQNFTCIKTKSLLNIVQTTICLHDERDAVSNQIQHDRIWEEEYLKKIFKFLQKNPHMSFIDVGANVGIYTMFVASYGRFVISIECFKPNIDRIRKAIEIEKVRDKVALFGNAIYRESGNYLRIKSDPFNVGSQGLIIDNSSNSLDKHDLYVVKTMRFDDILPILKQKNIRNAIMKVDIQWSEVFLCQTANKTFDYVNIPIILMEWETAPHYKILLSMSVVLHYFVNREYIPTIDMCTELSLTNAFKSWPKEIFWIKTNASRVC